jgi:hypothetical protein
VLFEMARYVVPQDGNLAKIGPYLKNHPNFEDPDALSGGLGSFP